MYDDDDVYIILIKCESEWVINIKQNIDRVVWCVINKYINYCC